MKWPSWELTLALTMKLLLLLLASYLLLCPFYEPNLWQESEWKMWLGSGDQTLVRDFSASWELRLYFSNTRGDLWRNANNAIQIKVITLHNFMRDKMIWLPSRVRWHLLVPGDAVDNDMIWHLVRILLSGVKLTLTPYDEDKRKLGPGTISIGQDIKSLTHLNVISTLVVIIIASHYYPCPVDSVVCFVWLIDW